MDVKIMPINCKESERRVYSLVCDIFSQDFIQKVKNTRKSQRYYALSKRKIHKYRDSRNFYASTCGSKSSHEFTSYPTTSKKKGNKILLYFDILRPEKMYKINRKWGKNSKNKTPPLLSLSSSLLSPSNGVL